jgi:hypothetical protein
VRRFAIRAGLLLVAAMRLGVAACEPAGVIGVVDDAAAPPTDAGVGGSASLDAPADARVDGIRDVDLEGATNEAGAADGGASDAAVEEDANPLCTGVAPPICLVGSTRWCSSAEGEWGTQRCTGPAGSATWGHCAAAVTAPSACTPGGFYDEDCCVQSGGCCAHAVDGIDYGSIGACGAIDPCNSCQQLCVRSGVRWCDFLDDVPDASGTYAWGQQACGDDGAWGTCAAVEGVPAGCDPAYYDGDCCAEAGACCQVYDSFGESASFGCPQTSCDEMWADAGDPTVVP